MELSMNVIDGGVSDNTIKLKGQMKGKVILILIDSGSTNSFMDGKTTKELKLEMMQVSPLTIAVADGRKLMVKAKCLGCTWAT
ncbi:hypothetical protein Patl1_37072 [Pistacia atlantica]|nr:hypothetical protein Patl1_37072 [Pistacia atlantica]